LLKSDCIHAQPIINPDLVVREFMTEMPQRATFLAPADWQRYLNDYMQASDHMIVVRQFNRHVEASSSSTDHSALMRLRRAFARDEVACPSDSCASGMYASSDSEVSFDYDTHHYPHAPVWNGTNVASLLAPDGFHIAEYNDEQWHNRVLDSEDSDQSSLSEDDVAEDDVADICSDFCYWPSCRSRRLLLNDVLRCGVNDLTGSNLAALCAAHARHIAPFEDDGLPKNWEAEHAWWI